MRQVEHPGPPLGPGPSTASTWSIPTRVRSTSRSWPAGVVQHPNGALLVDERDFGDVNLLSMWRRRQVLAIDGGCDLDFLSGTSTSPGSNSTWWAEQGRRNWRQRLSRAAWAWNNIGPTDSLHPAGDPGAVDAHRPAWAPTHWRCSASPGSGRRRHGSGPESSTSQASGRLDQQGLGRLALLRPASPRPATRPVGRSMVGFRVGRGGHRRRRAAAGDDHDEFMRPAERGRDMRS